MRLPIDIFVKEKDRAKELLKARSYRRATLMLLLVLEDFPRCVELP